MNTTAERAHAAFAETFGGAPDGVVHAPGRVNLIGEHTDYNDGFVLPCAIGVGTSIAVRARADARIEVVAADFDMARDGFDIDTPFARTRGWADYVHGTVVALRDAGIAFGGMDMAIAGDVPRGAGLSSSASLEIAVGHGLAPDLDRTRLAQIAQAAECDFVGTKCGIMDQLVSACGAAGQATLIDCRSLAIDLVAVPHDLAVLIVHSGVTRGLVEGHYNQRRAQCEAAARHYGVAALRDLDEAVLVAHRGTLDETSFRRAQHVVTENARTLAAADALRAHDLCALGALMAQSHASMRDDFEITVPPVDVLVALLADAIGEDGGARMTGGGFGGAVIALVAQDRLAHVVAAVEAGYRTPNGSAPLIMVERPASGVRWL